MAGRLPSASPRNKEQKADLEARVLRFRLGGMHFKEIAKQVGVSVGLCHKIVKRWHEETFIECKETIEQLRDKETGRLDQLQMAVWGNAMKGVIPASRQALAIIDRRIRLNGLDVASGDELTKAAIAAGLAAGSVSAQKKADSLSLEDASSAYHALLTKNVKNDPSATPKLAKH